MKEISLVNMLKQTSPKLTTFLTLFSLCLTQIPLISSADTGCGKERAVIEACDRALTDQLSLSEQQRELILQQKTQIESLSKPRPFYESPILWGVVGVVFGVWATKEIRK